MASGLTAWKRELHAATLTTAGSTTTNAHFSITLPGEDALRPPSLTILSLLITTWVGGTSTDAYRLRGVIHTDDLTVDADTPEWEEQNTHWASMVVGNSPTTFQIRSKRVLHAGEDYSINWVKDVGSASSSAYAYIQALYLPK